MGKICSGQLAEDQRAPREAPELIGIRERDAASDAEIVCGELLEEVADHPDKASKKEPEEDAAEGGKVKGSRVHAAIQPPHQREDGAELAKGECGDEGERVHAADVRLAIGH